MLLKIVYKKYKSNACFEFLGTNLEFDNMISHEGGFFTVISREETNKESDIIKHMMNSLSLEDNPFSEGTKEYDIWENNFQEYQDFRIQEREELYCW